MDFAWDPAKAAANLRKHGVDFSEAASVFGDPLSATFADPDRSEDEQRFVTVGGQPVASGGSMKKGSRKGRRALRREHSFARLQGGVRGKYAARYRTGTNLVRLDPDVARVFSSDAAVNSALRAVLDLRKTPAQKPAAKRRASRRAKRPRKRATAARRKDA